MANFLECVSKFTIRGQAVSADLGLNALKEHLQVQELATALRKILPGGVKPVQTFSQMQNAIAKDAVRKPATNEKTANLIYNRCVSYLEMSPFSHL